MMLNSGMFPFKARWNPRKLTVDNQEERSDQLGFEFDCNEVSRQRNKREVMPGGYVDNVAITIKTQDPICLKIQSEDSILYKGITYSVNEVRPKSSRAGIGRYEYYIDLTF